MRALIILSCLALAACGGDPGPATPPSPLQLRIGGEATNHCPTGPLQLGEHVTILGFSGSDAVVHQLQQGSPSYVMEPRSCLTATN